MTHTNEPPEIPGRFTTGQQEEATRAIGELLGLLATRPDNDVGTGPDVLWIEESTSTCIAFELKTGKDDPATYWKKDIAQGHDHLSWMTANYPDYNCLGRNLRRARWLRRN